MVRRLALTIGLTASLFVARSASADPVTPTDLDTFGLGAAFGSTVTAPFSVALAPPPTNGTLETSVFFDGTNYAYVHTVTPGLDDTFVFNTRFSVAGFTGVAGWSFSEAAGVGGSGTGSDFFLEETTSGRLNWVSLLGGSFGGWDTSEAITFFFVSTRPPTLDDYNLINSESGSAETLAPDALAPVPEPGTIALFGSGLMGLYAARRRRRSLQM